MATRSACFRSCAVSVEEVERTLPAVSVVTGMSDTLGEMLRKAKRVVARP